MDLRLRDFTRMNLLMFLGSKVNEDPQDFLHEVYKILFAMGVSLNDMDKTSCISTQGYCSNMVHSMEG